ncbi:tetratricopeptide repeat protein [Streptomyces sp. NPDC050803]|uniref:tetratricopeptide repeat protein n=1 Tax=unclassified Streptomyces TaxID=2593676 RepID=UPI00343DEA34
MFKGRLAGIGVGEYTSDAHKQLDHAVGDVEALSALLGGAFDGEPLRNPTEGEARGYLRGLRGTLAADSALVVVWSGHGSLPAAGGLRLLTTDSGTYADDGLGLTDVVLPCAQSGANQLLFVFDTCFSGDGISADDLATLIMRETRAAGQVWVGVITSCLPPEKARDGLFGQRLRKVLAVGPDLPELRMRWSVHNEYVRGDDVCDAVVKEWNSGAQTPDFRSRGSAWWMFRNPLYDAGAPEQVVEHLLRAARSGARLDEQSWFTGRTAEVDQVVEWVQAGSPGLQVVTGSAGTGKSAILGRVVSLSNPEERRRLLHEDGRPWSHELPAERSVSAHVHARGLTADLAAEQLAGQLVRTGLLTAREARRNASELVGEVQRAVEDGAEPPVLVLDGLDEARGEAFKLADDLLTRLAAHAVVVVSTRDMQRGEGPSLVATLAPEGAGIDLDDPEVRQRGRDDLRKYVRLRLSDVDPRMDAEAVAGHLFGEDAAEVQHTFLLARLVADQLSAAPVDTSEAGWEEKVSHSVEEALDTDLAAVPADSVDLAKSVLRALTWAYGAGFPEDEWLAVANVEAPEGAEVTREDLSRVLEQLGRHVVQDGEEGVAVYRMAHQSLADHLRPVFTGSAEQPFNPRGLAVAEALLGVYRDHLAAGIPAESPAYLWLYAWRHAADAGPEGLALLRPLAETSPPLLPDVGMTASFIGVRFQHWGLEVEAMPLIEESADLHRTLAENDTAYLPSLASALTHLSNGYGSLGRHHKALPPAEEALDLYSDLAESNPAHYPELAMALTNLGIRYSELGRHDDALLPTEQAVDLYRLLAEHEPAHLPDLASALNSLGIRYRNLGRMDEALSPAEEAVDLYRTLAERDPDHFADLAMALNNLGIRYGNLGRHREALAPAEESVRLRRVMALTNPAHLPSLASALSNLGTHYGSLGNHTDALGCTEEAYQLYRGLSDTNAAHLPNLAGSLNSLGTHYSSLGRHREALAAAEESVRLRRLLAETNPGYLPSLAGSLTNLGNHYQTLGLRTEALDTAKEAVDRWRTLAGTNRAYLPSLAGSLTNLGNRYSGLGRHSEALDCAREAVERWRVLAVDNLGHLPNLAGSLNSLGLRFSELGYRAEALDSAEEAVGLYRTLAETNPAHLPELASALTNLGIWYGEFDRHEDALPPTEEAVRSYRTLAETNPAHLPNLASALTNLGNHYSNLGRHREAQDLTVEAIGLYRTVLEANPAHLTDLASALANLGIHLGSLGDHTAALEPAEESVALYRTLAAANPNHLPDLAVAFTALANLYGLLGRSAEPLWADILGEATPVSAAHLLLQRSALAPAGDPSAAAWLAEVERSETAAESKRSRAAVEDTGLLWLLHAEGRRHRAADPEAFDREWRRLTAEPPPAWLTLDHDLLEQVRAWVDTESYSAERNHLAAHPEILAPEADVCVDEILSGLTDDAAERYRALRQSARSEGVEAAYRPILSSVLAYEFATASYADRRTLLAQRRADLLDDYVFGTLSSEAADAEDRRLFSQAYCLLRLAQQGAEAAAFDALDDPSLFPALLHDAARQPDPVALHAAALVALTAATDDSSMAEAEFHLAIAIAAADDGEQAAEALAAACDRTPDAIPTWIDALVDITPHHPAARTLVPRLTARLRRTTPDDH